MMGYLALLWTNHNDGVDRGPVNATPASNQDKENVRKQKRQRKLTAE